MPVKAPRPLPQGQQMAGKVVGLRRAYHGQLAQQPRGHQVCRGVCTFQVMHLQPVDQCPDLKLFGYGKLLAERSVLRSKI